MDPHNYLLMTLDGNILGGLFEHERLKPAIIRYKSWQCNQFSSIETCINSKTGYIEMEILGPLV